MRPHALAVLAAAAVTLALAPSRAGDALVKEKTQVFVIEAPAAIAPELARRVRAMEQMAERARLGKKPKERRFVIAPSVKECPKVERPSFTVGIAPGAPTDAVIDEAADYAASGLVEAWFGNQGVIPVAGIRQGLKDYLSGLEPPGKGEKLPRALELGQAAIFGLLRAPERGDDITHVTEAKYVGQCGGWELGVVLFALEGSSSEARKLRSKLDAALKGMKPGGSNEAEPFAFELAPKAKLGELQQQIATFVQFGATERPAARAGALAALRAFYEKRLGATWKEPGAKVELPKDAFASNTPFVRAVHQAVAPESPAWLQAACAAYANAGVFALGRLEPFGTSNLFFKAQSGRTQQDCRLPALFALPAEKFFFAQDAKEGQRGPWESDAVAAALLHLALDGDGAPAKALFEDPTAAGLEKAFGKPPAEVDVALEAFEKAHGMKVAPPGPFLVLPPLGR